MPAVVPVVAALAASQLGPVIGVGLLNAGIGLTAAQGIFAGQLIGAIAGFGINAIGSRALAKKPKAQSAGGTNDPGLRTVVRLSDASHRIIYGRVRVGGVLTYISSTSSGPSRSGSTVTGENRFLHMVIALAGHEVDDIGEIYFNDTLVTLDANGWATSAPYTDSTSTTTRRLLYGLTKLQRTSGVVTATFASSSPHGLSTGDTVSLDMANSFGGGPYIVTSTPTPTTFTFSQAGANQIVNSPGGTTSATSSAATFNSYVRIRKHLGSDDQPADPLMLAECPDWTAAHRMRGISYLYVRLQWNPDVFPTGIPTVNAVVRGKKVYDPRDVSQSANDRSTWKWSENAALCTRDYIHSRDAAGQPYGYGAANEEIDDDYTIAAANVSDEPVTKLDGNVVPRYTCNGVIDTAVAPSDNLQSLVTASAGAVTCPKGKFRVYAGAYDAPEDEVIDESWLTGSLKSRNRIPRQELFNAVRGTYINPSAGWQNTDFPPVTSAIYEAEDDGERIYTDIELPFTIDPEACQRIAKIIQRKGREQITVTMPLNYRALQFAVWDVVKVNNAARGWVEKPFRIENFTFDLASGVVVRLKEENPLSYDWSASDAQAVEAAPDTNLPSAFNVGPPKGLEITEGTYVTRDGAGVKAYAAMKWVASQDAFLAQYQPEYKLSADSTWTVLPRTDATTAEILDVDPGVYDFRVKALNTLGVSSAYSTASRSISGLLAPPSAPTGLSIATIGGLAVLTWDPTADLDVKIGGTYIVRHSPDPVAAWIQTTSIGNPIPGASTQVILPLKPGVYMMRAVDSSGVQSDDFAGVATDQATALAFENVSTLTENPTFSGAKLFCYVRPDNTLAISGLGFFSAIPLLSDEPSVAYYGGLWAVGYYDFSGGVDLASVRRVRITSHLKATIFDPYDRIGSRTQNISTWDYFSALTGTSKADAKVFIRTTKDDPSGTPTWSEYSELHSGEYEIRAFQTQAVLRTYDLYHNIAVSELSISTDEVV